MKVLLLGGTGEARELASRLRGHEVLTSLAGAVADPRLPEGEVRIGGFGGAEGLAEWLVEHRIEALVDATHPYAARITANAHAAAAAVGVPALILDRPSWPADPSWLRVASAEAAAASLAAGERVFLTIGRQHVGAFAGADAWFLVRSIDPPTGPLPARHELLLARGPFEYDDELALLREHRIDTLVTKNSGGPATVAKLDAARALGVRIVVIDRPPLPAGARVVETADAVADWVGQLARAST
ncbi:cobalt-precorrin-6A reductase [Nocardioides speluncae]|uniref:cobalt-precorrin-6A reductase n=1 Tax=Nocardioides speluncae TaxID=2670337 RepID=UPI000D697515|nr:cobalt-precorrin-6A reductase [Nocardioides speluncae]